MKASKRRQKPKGKSAATHDVRLPLPTIWGNEASRVWSSHASDVEKIVAAFKNEFAFDSDGERGRFRELLRKMLFLGFHLAATPAQRRRKRAAHSGAIATSQKAEARRFNIIAAYDATDASLPEADRYAAVKQATGVRSDETIRKALRAR